MDEVRSHVRLDLPFVLTARRTKRLLHPVLESHDGRALVPIPEEKREPVSDIDTATVDSLKVLDPKRPIREADVQTRYHIELSFTRRFRLRSEGTPSNYFTHSLSGTASRSGQVIIPL